MTEQEKKQRIAELRAELKELQAPPRSDWHKAFEAFLRSKTYKYKGVSIRTEVEIGADVPRTDYVILTDEETEEFEETIFKIFKKINILEYRNPYDSLNERAIYKASGYAHFLIGTAEHDGDVPANQITISIFRAVKNPDLFNKWVETGKITNTETPGIYHVVGITDLPFQIVITNELIGDEYAACRALTDKANEVDVERVIEDGKKEQNNVVRAYYKTILELIAEKNPEIITKIRRNATMGSALMELMKEDVGKVVTAKEQETKALDIRNVMESFGVTMEKAMESLKIPPAQQATYAGLVGKLK